MRQKDFGSILSLIKQPGKRLFDTLEVKMNLVNSLRGMTQPCVHRGRIPLWLCIGERFIPNADEPSAKTVTVLVANGP